MAPPSASQNIISQPAVDVNASWLPWAPPAGDEARDRLKMYMFQAGVADVDNFLNQSQMCHVDNEGSLVLKRPDGSMAVIPIRGLVAKMRIPPSMAGDIMIRGMWNRKPSDLTPIEREFVVSRQMPPSLCNAGYSFHSVPRPDDKPTKGDFVLACHSAKNTETPEFSGECVDPLTGPVPKKCFKLYDSMVTHFDLRAACLPGGQANPEPVTQVIKIGKEETLAIVTGYKPGSVPVQRAPVEVASAPALMASSLATSEEESHWWKWALAAGGAVATAGGIVAVFLLSGEEPASFPAGSIPEPGPGPGPGPSPQPEPPATGTTSTRGRRGGRGN